MAASTFKSSINVKSVGNPQKFIAKHDLSVGQKGLFATIFGVANGVVKRADAKDPDKFYYGLKGTFEALSGDAENPSEAVGSSALFAPDAIHDRIAEQLLPRKDANGKVVSDGATAVSFAFQAYVVAGGTAGFTWEYRFVQQGEPEEEDILASVRALIKPNDAPRLEAPKDDAAEPAKTKGKAKSAEAA